MHNRQKYKTSALYAWDGLLKWVTSCAGRKRTISGMAFTSCEPLGKEFITECSISLATIPPSYLTD